MKINHLNEANDSTKDIKKYVKDMAIEDTQYIHGIEDYLELRDTLRARGFNVTDKQAKDLYDTYCEIYDTCMSDYANEDESLDEDSDHQARIDRIKATGNRLASKYNKPMRKKDYIDAIINEIYNSPEAKETLRKILNSFKWDEIDHALDQYFNWDDDAKYEFLHKIEKTNESIAVEEDLTVKDAEWNDEAEKMLRYYTNGAIDDSLAKETRFPARMFNKYDMDTMKRFLERKKEAAIKDWGDDRENNPDVLAKVKANQEKYGKQILVNFLPEDEYNRMKEEFIKKFGTPCPKYDVQTGTFSDNGASHMKSNN